MVDRSVDCVCVVTGASGGLGEALAITAAKIGAAVILVGRHRESLSSVGARCESAGATKVTLITADLGSGSGLDSVSASLGGGLLSGYRKVVLYNNASTIDPIESFAELSFEGMERALSVNVSAAVALASTVVRLSRDLDIEEASVVNISSGVSINPVMGWSAYCISKAALNMVTKCIAVETASARRPVYSISVNPGPVDTRMQERIRNADKNKSPAAEKFSRMHQEGKLQKPEDVAVKLFDILSSRRFATGEFVDFNQLK
jgi:benzil reductase ((S)-benzoin forming)